MNSIEQLKLAARQREEEREASEMERQQAYLHAIAQRNDSLAEMLKASPVFAPLFLAGTPRCNDAEARALDVVVSFQIPGHAELQARFVWEKNDGDIPGYWEHVGFKTNKGYDYAYWVNDPEKMWNVLKFKGITRVDEGEDGWKHRASFESNYFADLGDALLFAERAYRDPVVIERKIAELDAKEADATAVADNPPKPTAAEDLAEALNAFVDERIEQKNNDRLLSNW